MSGISTLLALTDLSGPARHAVARAAMLARSAGARMELLHVTEASALDDLRALLGSAEANVTERLQLDLRATLDELVAQTCNPLQVVPGVQLLTGQPIAMIPAQAAACAADLIVLGARGEGFLRHLLLGSTAERLLRKTMSPLLVVRQMPHEDYQRLLVPVDFSAWSLAAVRLARQVAPQAELILYHAYAVPFEGKLRFAGVDDGQIQVYRRQARDAAKRQLGELAAQAGLQEGDYRAIVTRSAAEPGILEQEQEQAIDLIVIGKHGAGMMEELLLGSTTKHVLVEANCDVLVTQQT